MSENEDTGVAETLSFDALDLPEPIRRALKEIGYETPTPVQHAAFEPALKGKDLVVQARTGTGKTCAFGLPLLSGRTSADVLASQALILTPTRELALQVKRELEALAQFTKLSVVSVYGGAPMGKQIDELKEGAHIIVGTPGRVLDHLERRTLDPSTLRCFVLDECDEMLSMGFLPQITEIWNQIPSSAQTLLFSATVPRQVERIAETRLKNPEFITLSGDHVGALSIQHFVFLSHGDKPRELLQILDIENPESAIVFCNTRDETKRVCRVLQEAGYDADWLNSDLNQNEREKVMKATREGNLRFLVCTDVAARGIDISHLTHVINYDFPDNSENYVHRTGRTGRAGRMGTALSLIEPGSIGDLYYLRLKYKIEPVERHLPTRAELKTRAEADVIAMLALRFPLLPAGSKHVSLARRLMTHDSAESIIGGLLAQHLGEAEPAEKAAEEQRRKAAPRPVAETPARNGATRRGEGRKPRAGAESHAKPRAAKAPPNAAHFEEEGIGYVVSDAVGGSDDLPAAATAKPAAAATSRKVAAAQPAPRPASGPAAAAEPQTLPAAARNDAEHATLYLNIGRKDGASTETIRDALTEAGVSAESVASIALKQRHCFVNVAEASVDHTLERLTGITVCGRTIAPERARPRTETSDAVAPAET